MKATASRKRIVVRLLVAAVASAFSALVTLWNMSPDASPPDRSYALGYARLADFPASAEVTHESQGGWHFETIQFTAAPMSVNRWLAASPTLLSREPVVEASGERFYPCTNPPPPDADGDTPEGDCTTVRVSKDGGLVTIHLVIPASSYAAH